MTGRAPAGRAGKGLETQACAGHLPRGDSYALGPVAALAPNRSDTSGLVTERWLGADVRCYRDRPRTIVELLDRAWRLHPQRIALETPEGDVTYAELAELVDGAAERLAEEGIAPGDRVAVALRNGLDIVVAIWACARLEAVFVGLSTRLAPPQWAYVLGHSEASLALAHPEYLESLQQAAAEAGIPADRVRPVDDHLTGRRRQWDADRALPDQDSSYAVIYTSGTTGRPKASRMVHRGSVHSAIAYVRTMALTADDRTAITFPLYYMTGHIAQVSTMMLTGGTCVTVTDLAASRLVALVAEKRITYLMDPAATAQAITPDGWLRSGDPCRIDDEGYVYLLDRMKDVVIRGGNKVYSVELEYLLARHPDIEQAAVFGIPDALAFE